MSYQGSHMWQLRQKVGNMRVITATVNVLPTNSDGKIKLVYIPRIDRWSHVGGHVELGDSWSSAAIHELEEEAGIIATEADLIPFGAISGPERIFHYPDGETQPFSLCFCIKQWNDEIENTDKEEVSKNAWFKIEDALELNITPECHNVLLGYQKYLKTGNFQMIEDKR